MELANTCEIYRRAGTGNHKAAGVCYNNIANLHLKTGKYEIAATNYAAAMRELELCLERQITGEPDWDYFKEVLAHRRYQLAVALYKGVRYGSSTVLGRGGRKVGMSHQERIESGRE